MQTHTSTDIFRFEVENGVSEYHAILRITNPLLNYTEQVNALLAAYEQLVLDTLPGAVAVFKRFFLSDAANQADYLQALLIEHSDCAVSVVEQAPLDGTKIALWVYLQSGVSTRNLPHGDYEVSHGGYRHIWSAYNYNKASKSEYQTRLLLNDYTMRIGFNLGHRGKRYSNKGALLHFNNVVMHADSFRCRDRICRGFCFLTANQQ